MSSKGVMSMSDALNKILNDAIPQWAELTGTRLGTNSYTFTLGSNSEFQDYGLKKYIDDLNEARTLDMSGTTALLLLRGLFEAYVQERVFKIHAMLYEPEKIESTLSKMRAFHALITSPVCEETVVEFRESVRAAAVHYGYDLGKLTKHLADDRALGELRLAAARSCEKLDVHQFTQGKPDPKPLQYNREIFEFTNINSFVAALHKQWISGITLALVRDSSDERGGFKSFFVLGLRNGANITVLTDYEEGVHPEYHNMTRRPERQLDARARCHWFPYRLLDEDPIKRAKNKRALVAKDARAIAVDEVSKLEPPEFIWLTLLFELITEKYGGDFKTAELSYTGEMIIEPQALLGSAHALVVTDQYRPLVLPKLTPETTTREAADNREPVGHNAWMEERYRHRVPEILLNVLGARRALEVGKQASRLLPSEVIASNLPPERRQPNVIGWGPDHRKTALVPHAVDPTCFGTRTQIERNRVWSARVNMMQAVQKFAVSEFAEKHALVLRWYRARIARNMPFLWGAVARGELVAPVMRWQHTVEHGFPLHDAPVWSEENILQQRTAKDWRHAFPGDRFQNKGVEIGQWDDDRRGVMCGKDPSRRASVFTVIQPGNPRALALLCGIPEGKLPWPLRCWSTSEPYTGNSILDRVDPQDWRLDNPWRHLELRITIALCKRAFVRLRKEHGLGTSTLTAQGEE
jgi:hypothetical protein